MQWSPETTKSHDLQKAIRQSGLPPARRVVLLAVYDLLRDVGAAVLSVDRIAREASVSARTVHRALTDLELAEIIRRETRFYDGRREGVIRAASRIVLNVAALKTLCHATRETVRDRLDAAYARMAVRLVQRRQVLEKIRAQRSASLSRVVEERDILSSSDAAALAVSGSIAENRAALKACYVPPHLRKAL